MECDFNTFLCGLSDYSGNFATIITRSSQKCVGITFHFLQCIACLPNTSGVALHACLSLPAFQGHAGNISVNYSVYGYVESNGRHWEADFVRRSGHTCLLNTCSQLLIVNFNVLVACLTGLRCIPLDFMLFISQMKIRTKFLNRLIH